MTDNMQQMADHGDGRLYEANGFVVPVLAGTSSEMGHQYGALMRDHMQQTWDVLIEPGRAFFPPEDHDNRHYRLAYSSIPAERIEEGLEILAEQLA